MEANQNVMEDNRKNCAVCNTTTTNKIKYLIDLNDQIASEPIYTYIPLIYLYCFCNN